MLAAVGHHAGKLANIHCIVGILQTRQGLLIDGGVPAPVSTMNSTSPLPSMLRVYVVGRETLLIHGDGFVGIRHQGIAIIKASMATASLIFDPRITSSKQSDKKPSFLC